MKFKTFMTTMVMSSMVASSALAWGDVGHRMIGEEAMRALPDYMPDFLRTPSAIADVGEFSREPDRWRNSGKVHDSDRDAAHFVDLDDAGNTLAGLPLDQLPATRFDFDAATRAKGFDPWKSGYLPYSEVDGYQQIVKDMAQWRVLNLLESKETDKAKKAWYHADRMRREALLLRDIGILSHYVGDASQPLHLSIHYNGWGDYPNPNGFTTERVHVPLEGDYVSKTVTAADVRADMTPYTPCTDRIDLCFAARMKKTFIQVVPMYQLEKDGGFKDGDARGKTFMTQQISKGASDLRDVILDAWRDSKSIGIGYPTAGTTYDDYLAGKVADPWLTLHGA